MLVVRATKKLRDRLPNAVAPAEAASTTLLGDWYGTVMLWRPQLALFVNEATLLPVLMPFAPSATLLDRLPLAVAEALDAHGVDGDVIDGEVAAMPPIVVAPTANRSVVGVMNEFVSFADIYRHDPEPAGLLEQSLQLADIPCGPLYKREVTPARELPAYVYSRQPPPEGDSSRGRSRR